MSTQDDLRAVAGKALADPEFRQKLIDDPEAAVKEAGIEITDEQMKALKEMDKEQFEEGLSQLDERLTKACWGYRVAAAPLHIPDPIDGMPFPLPSNACAWA